MRNHLLSCNPPGAGGGEQTGAYNQERGVRSYDRDQETACCLAEGGGAYSEAGGCGAHPTL